MARSLYYLNSSIGVHDDISVMKETIRFTMYIKKLFYFGELNPDDIPYLYHSIFPEMFNNLSRTQLDKRWNNVNPMNDFQWNIYFNIFNRTTDNDEINIKQIRERELEFKIINILAMQNERFQDMIENENIYNEFIETTNNFEFIDTYWCPLRRSYPVYFPITYHIQRKFQIIYDIKNPSFEMMKTYFELHLLKSNYLYLENERVNNLRDILFYEPDTISKFRYVGFMKVPKEIIEEKKKQLKNNIKTYYWQKKKIYILHRFAKRSNIGIGM
jgi:hypothetical protein